MKTLCTNTDTDRKPSTLVTKLLLAVTATLICLANNAGAQTPPTPIGVTSAGIGPLTFDTIPNLADGWSTRSFGDNTDGGGAAVTTVAALDALVQGLSASMINTNLGQSSTQPPSANGIARWHSVNHYIQSRPTANDYLVLMATFRNDTGADQSGAVVSYDFDVQSPASGEIPGFRAFYSLSGAPNSWVPIPEFSDSETAGNKSVGLTFASAWETGARLYILWADDNANGITDPSYTIDNFVLNFPNQPIAIVTQPHDTTVETCQATNLSVVVSGSLPIYQWFKGVNPIPGATAASYSIPSAAAADAGTYFVRVHNNVNSVDSTHVTVNVRQDETEPTVSSALVRVNLTNITVVFSEKMDAASVNDRFSYHLAPAPDGAATELPSAVSLAADGVTATLSFDNPLTANKTYQLLIDPNVTDCSGNVLAPRNGENQIVVSPHYEIHLISFTTSSWKYNHLGEDLAPDWRTDPGYDDTAWSNGLSAFDGKNTGDRASIGGVAVNTHLPLHYGVYTSDDVPVYYFRTHFTLPSPVGDVSSLTLRTLIDDFDVAYMNNYDAPVHTRAGLTASPDSYGYSGGTAVGDAAVEGPFSISPTNLVAGDNVVAVKLFQQALASSDITFGYELTAVVSSFLSVGPRLSISYDGSLVTVTWPDGGEQLYEADTVDGPWSPVGAGGTYSAAATGSAKFYTLRQ